jgi:hypothetical protein
MIKKSENYGTPLKGRIDENSTGVIIYIFDVTMVEKIFCAKSNTYFRKKLLFKKCR